MTEWWAVEHQIKSLDDKLALAHNLKTEQEAFAGVNKCRLHARQARLLPSPFRVERQGVVVLSFQRRLRNGFTCMIWHIPIKICAMF